ncbi:hypothetical protein M8818_005895 [Zalaria obscura]|uniref:Uncharacterized protein n=1 Tax=Zalaria obscura TaxID=2024903 RepID=A0ACC3S8K9_9PEZI
MLPAWQYQVPGEICDHTTVDESCVAIASPKILQSAAKKHPDIDAKGSICCCAQWSTFPTTSRWTVVESGASGYTGWRRWLGSRVKLTSLWTFLRVALAAYGRLPLTATRLYRLGRSEPRMSRIEFNIMHNQLDPDLITWLSTIPHSYSYPTIISSLALESTIRLYLVDNSINVHSV